MLKYKLQPIILAGGSGLRLWPLSRKNLPKQFSLFETVLVAANDELVNLFLKKQIKFTDISKILLKILKAKKFTKYKGLKPKKIDDIIQLNRYVRSVINNN